jgi:hypothetical protein
VSAEAPARGAWREVMMKTTAKDVARNLAALLLSDDPQPEAITARLNQAIADLSVSHSEREHVVCWFRCWAISVPSTAPVALRHGCRLQRLRQPSRDRLDVGVAL